MNKNINPQLLSTAAAFFMRFGIKSVSMDDLARELGISKKTLYEQVESKSILVKEIMKMFLELEIDEICQIENPGKNAIDEFVEIGRNVLRHLKNLNPSVMYDLGKYYPEAKQIHDQFKYEVVKPLLIRNMEKGIEQGVVRDDIDSELISTFYISKMDLITNIDLFPPSKYKSTDIYLQFLKYHIHGIASVKGKKRLEKIISKTNESEND